MRPARGGVEPLERLRKRRVRRRSPGKRFLGYSRTTLADGAPTWALAFVRERGRRPWNWVKAAAEKERGTFYDPRASIRHHPLCRPIFLLVHARPRVPVTRPMRVTPGAHHRARVRAQTMAHNGQQRRKPSSAKHPKDRDSIAPRLDTRPKISAINTAHPTKAVRDAVSASCDASFGDSERLQTRGDRTLGIVVSSPACVPRRPGVHAPGTPRNGDAEQPRGAAANGLFLAQAPQPRRRRSLNWVKAFSARRHCAADFPAGDLTPLASPPAAANRALPPPITSRDDSHEKERRRNGSSAPHDQSHGHCALLRSEDTEKPSVAFSRKVSLAIESALLGPWVLKTPAAVPQNYRNDQFVQQRAANCVTSAGKLPVLAPFPSVLWE